MSGLALGLVPDASTTPFIGMFAFFLFIVVVRTQITYWLARILTERAVSRGAPRNGALRRFHGWLTGGGVDSGITAIHRWGIIVIPLSFLFTGTKTVINAAAGVTRMPFGRYTVVMLVGCLTHATIYATVGWAAWTAVVHAAAGSPWAFIAFVVALVAIAVTAVVHRRGRRARRTQNGAAPMSGALGAVLGIHEHGDAAHHDGTDEAGGSHQSGG